MSVHHPQSQIAMLYYFLQGCCSADCWRRGASVGIIVGLGCGYGREGLGVEVAFDGVELGG